jgi:hypothetical protein
VVQITLHGWLGKYGDMGGGAGGGLSVGGGSEEDAGIDVVEGPEAEGEGDAGDVGDDGDEEADDAELLVSSSEDENPSSCIILTF